MKIACIILNYNTSSDCQKCASFLLKQKDADLELIFVDNHSSNEDRGNLHKYCLQYGLTFLFSQNNKGYNAGNNIGLRYAADKGYKYVLITNPDMEFPQHNYLSKMIETMEKNPSIAVCGSDIITPEGIHQNPMKRDGNWKNSFGWLTRFLKKKPANSYSFIDNYEYSHYCSKVSGCCLMVRMSFIEEIGYFDENIFLYCEEAILSKQVERSGKWKMYYLSEAQATHRHIKSEKGNPIARFKQWKESRIYYINHYSNDSWFGKKIAIISLSLNILATTSALYVKRMLK